MRHGWMVFLGVTLACVVTLEVAVRLNVEWMGLLALGLALLAINRGSQALHDTRIARDQRIRERVKLEFRTGHWR